MNNFNLFTSFLHPNNLCTFTRMVDALYKPWIQNAKALIKKNKRHLRTLPVLLYLLLLLSFQFFNNRC